MDSAPILILRGGVGLILGSGPKNRPCRKKHTKQLPRDEYRTDIVSAHCVHFSPTYGLHVGRTVKQLFFDWKKTGNADTAVFLTFQMLATKSLH